jgi:hypothetical protein
LISVKARKAAPVLSPTMNTGPADKSPQHGKLWVEDGVPHLDVRGLQPPQPMVSILRVLEGPESEDGLIVHLDREPIYLFPELVERGWTHEILLREPDEVRLAIRRRP